MPLADDFAQLPADPHALEQLERAGLRYTVVDTADRDTYAAWARADMRGFLSPETTDQGAEAMRTALGSRRTIAVWDDSLAPTADPVGTLSSWPSELTLPGLNAVAGWAISSVTVAQTHRRRGIARNLIEAELRTTASHGLPFATLTVSESTIYGRFGFSPATFAAHWSINARRVSWAGPHAPGRIDYVTREQWVDAVVPVFEAARAQRVGEIEAWPGMWQRMAGVVTEDEAAARKLRAITYTSPDGSVEGVALFELEKHAVDFTEHTLRLTFLRASTADAYAGLWKFLVEHDLVATIVAGHQAVAEPVGWMLGDRRAATVSMTDHQWVRIVDVAAALEARTYGAAGQLRFEVTDPLGYAAGLFELTVDDEGQASVRRTPAEEQTAPEVVLTVQALGSIFLGAVAPTTLVASAAIQERAPGAAARADRMFVTSPAPAPGIWY